MTRPRSTERNAITLLKISLWRDIAERSCSKMCPSLFRKPWQVRLKNGYNLIVGDKAYLDQKSRSEGLKPRFLTEGTLPRGGAQIYEGKDFRIFGPALPLGRSFVISCVSLSHKFSYFPPLDISDFFVSSEPSINNLSDEARFSKTSGPKIGSLDFSDLLFIMGREQWYLVGTGGYCTQKNNLVQIEPNLDLIPNSFCSWYLTGSKWLKKYFGQIIAKIGQIFPIK